MPGPQRCNGNGLINELLADPHRFEFFQAVHLLERWLIEGGDVGADLLPKQLRFANSLALSFPPSEIAALQVSGQWLRDVTRKPDSRPSEIVVTPAFMGLLGIGGTLPLVYTEQLMILEFQHKEIAARRFLDLFSHRAVALFYVAWKKSRLHLHEQSEKGSLESMTLSLCGLGFPGLRSRLGPAEGGIDDRSLAFFAGTLQRRVLSGGPLRQLLAHCLAVPVALEQFVGRWCALPEPAQSKIGVHNGVLGHDALVGERVWQRDMCVRIVLGPLSHSQFRRFLPAATGSLALRRLLASICGASLDFEVNLVLESKAVRGCTLDTGRPASESSLGWDTYLVTTPQFTDRCDVRYELRSGDCLV